MMHCPTAVAPRTVASWWGRLKTSRRTKRCYDNILSSDLLPGRAIADARVRLLSKLRRKVSYVDALDSKSLWLRTATAAARPNMCLLTAAVGIIHRDCSCEP